jgi:hypothetical protein
MNSGQTDGSLKYISELIGYLNNCFEPPYSYILYSFKFRRLFNIKTIFNTKKSLVRMRSKEDVSLTNSNKSDGSNKSILENLLS